MRNEKLNFEDLLRLETVKGQVKGDTFKAFDTAVKNNHMNFLLIGSGRPKIIAEMQNEFLKEIVDISVILLANSIARHSIWTGVDAWTYATGLSGDLKATTELARKHIENEIRAGRDPIFRATK